jgi:hypothetical protein
MYGVIVTVGEVSRADCKPARSALSGLKLKPLIRSLSIEDWTKLYQASLNREEIDWEPELDLDNPADVQEANDFHRGVATAAMAELLETIHPGLRRGDVRALLFGEDCHPDAKGTMGLSPTRLALEHWVIDLFPRVQMHRMSNFGQEVAYFGPLPSGRAKQLERTVETVG